MKGTYGISEFVAQVQDRDSRRRGTGLKPSCHFVNTFFVCKLFQYVLAYSCMHSTSDIGS